MAHWNRIVGASWELKLLLWAAASEDQGTISSYMALAATLNPPAYKDNNVHFCTLPLYFATTELSNNLTR